jgi:hypothetical protein
LGLLLPLLLLLLLLLLLKLILGNKVAPLFIVAHALARARLAA